MKIGALLLACVAAGGCSTQGDLLELKRDRLLAIEANAISVRDGIPRESFIPERYDVYFAMDADVFERAFSEIEGLTFDVEAKGRPIAFSVDRFTTEFRPGSPVVSLAATAVDQRSGIEAAVDIDTRLVLTGDPAYPDEMTARIYATRVVPDLRWGPLNFTRSRFVRALLALEVSKLTDQFPAVQLPLSSAFAFGEPARSLDSGPIDTGNNSYIRGRITLPSTEVKGQFVVDNVLFLENGVHIFASVKGA